MAHVDDARVGKAVDAALLQGLLKYTPRGTLAHAPFVLDPWPIAPLVDAALRALTPLFGELAWRVGRDLPFLEEALGAVAKVDSAAAEPREISPTEPAALPAHHAQ